MKINKEQIVSIRLNDRKESDYYKYVEAKEEKIFRWVIDRYPAGFSGGPMLPFYHTEEEFLKNNENCVIENKVVYSKPCITITTSDGKSHWKYFENNTERDGYFHNQLSQLNLID